MKIRTMRGAVSVDGSMINLVPVDKPHVETHAAED